MFNSIENIEGVPRNGECFVVAAVDLERKTDVSVGFECFVADSARFSQIRMFFCGFGRSLADSDGFSQIRSISPVIREIFVGFSTGYIFSQLNLSEKKKDQSKCSSGAAK